MSICSRCGAEFSCAMLDAAPDRRCWCTALPSLHSDWPLRPMAERAGARCVCRICLQALLAAVDTPGSGATG